MRTFTSKQEEEKTMMKTEEQLVCRGKPRVCSLPKETRKMNLMKKRDNRPCQMLPRKIKLRQ